MEKNLFNQEEFFKSLSPGQFVRSYFYPKKIFEIKEGERLTSKGINQKLIQDINFNQREYWITATDCLIKTIML
jgi:hypothetical protein